jgi:hypothetical protein
MNTTELVAAIKAYALKHYEDGGWDVVIEAWTDEQIAETIGKASTLRGAIWKMNRIVAVYADRQADARNSSGESTVKITDTSRELFAELAADAGNWGGTPLLDGNVGTDRHTRGNLTQLKKAGLISTFTDEDRNTFVEFTHAGAEYADILGFDLHRWAV